ncbi:MAG: enoyl-CoA hydratase [Alphaproteobacteria bacterium]|nr:enoyl-CoA hydratase [Alphaproteobacteria bacterium]
MPDKPGAEAPILLRETDGAVAILTLNRPEARNALSEELMSALQSALDAIAADKAVKAVVITANGPAFCAGHDLKQLIPHTSDADKGQAYFAKLFGQCSKLMQTIVRLPKPVIAQVHGVATAAGCQLVASCDLAVASDAARFATPGVNIGLFCSTPMVALSRNVPRKVAMEMLLTGDLVDAKTARSIGLINHVTTHDELRVATMHLARKIASKSCGTVALGKEAFYRQLEMPLSAAYDYASEVMTRNMMMADANEGICAFIDKRNPKWET